MDLYGAQLKKLHSSLVECEDFDGYFDQQMRELEGTADLALSPGTDAVDLTPPSSDDNGPGDAPPPLPNVLKR